MLYMYVDESGAGHETIIILNYITGPYRYTVIIKFVPSPFLNFSLAGNFGGELKIWRAYLIRVRCMHSACACTMMGHETTCKRNKPHKTASEVISGLSIYSASKYTDLSVILRK